MSLRRLAHATFTARAVGCQARCMDQRYFCCFISGHYVNFHRKAPASMSHGGGGGGGGGGQPCHPFCTHYRLINVAAVLLLEYVAGFILIKTRLFRVHWGGGGKKIIFSGGGCRYLNVKCVCVCVCVCVYVCVCVCVCVSIAMKFRAVVTLF